MKTLSSFPTEWGIVFTGRLASMSRIAAIRVITDQGGFVRNRVTRQTDLLVIGADGWPLRRSGSITLNLQQASKFQESGSDLSIIGEAEFLRRLCDSEDAQPIRREHTLEQLSRLLGISGLRLRRWLELGLIQAVDETAFSPTFDFQQVAAAKTLAQLVGRGVSPKKLANSLRELRRWLPGDLGLENSILALEKELLIRNGENLIDATGQLHFSFNHCNEIADSRADTNRFIDDADALFDQAYEHERANQDDRAIACYADWLERYGDDHDVLFNLANVYRRSGWLEAAIDHYRRCVEIDPLHARAWNNLGLCYYQTSDIMAAIDALRRSIEIEPDNVDLLYNLADTLDEAGTEAEVRLLWMRIARLHHESDNEIHQYALARLREAQCKPVD